MLFDLDIDYDQTPPDLDGRHVLCRLSGGAGSAIATMRCVEWYGQDRVSIVAADTMSESDANYALVDAVEKESGLPVERLCQNKDIWDVFDEFGVMRMALSGGACKASVELKQKPLDDYTSRRFSVDGVVIATGLSYEERMDRQPRFIAKLAPWTCFFPLNVRPRLSACQIVAELKRYNLPVSDAYEKGLDHDNCKGGCILQGARQWAGLLKDDPEHFAHCEQRERAFFERTGFAALRDRRGGDVKPYPLFQLRADIENGRKIPDDWRSKCSCMMLGETPDSP